MAAPAATTKPNMSDLARAKASLKKATTRETEGPRTNGEELHITASATSATSSQQPSPASPRHKVRFSSATRTTKGTGNDDSFDSSDSGIMDAAADAESNRRFKQEETKIKDVKKFEGPVDIDTLRNMTGSAVSSNTLQHLLYKYGLGNNQSMVSAVDTASDLHKDVPGKVLDAIGTDKMPLTNHEHWSKEEDHDSFAASLAGKKSFTSDTSDLKLPDFKVPQSHYEDSWREIQPASIDDPIYSIVAHREKDKKEIQGLNFRLENYIDHVNRLESQNAQLKAELQVYQEKLEKMTAELKIKMEIEVEETIHLVDETNLERGKLEERARELEGELDDLKRQYEDLVADRNSSFLIHEKEKQLSDKEGKINALKRLIDTLEQELNDLLTRLNSIRQQLEYERRQQKLELTAKIQDLRNRLEHLQNMKDNDKRAHEDEVNRLKMQIASKPKKRDQKEMDEELLIELFCEIHDESNVIPREIGHPSFPPYIRQLVYDRWTEPDRLREEAARLNAEADVMEEELYTLRDDNSRLKRRIAELESLLASRRRQWEAILMERQTILVQLHEKLSALMMDFTALMQLKMKLEAILASLKKRMELFEGDRWLYMSQELIDIVKTLVQYVHIEGYSMEQKRTLAKVIIGSIPRSHPGTKESAMTTLWLELAPSKTRVDRTNKGPITIREVDGKGRWIIVENASFTTRTDVHIGQWLVKRFLKGNKYASYTFPKDYILHAETEVILWANCPGAKHDPPFEIVVPHVNSWGDGLGMVSVLYNDKDEEKATHIEVYKNVGGYR